MRLAAIDIGALARVERLVETALGGDAAAADDAVRQLEGLPEATPDLVAACILRGGTPLDAPTGETVCEHTLAGGEKRRYAVSVPETGLPTRPRALLLLLQASAGAPEGARGVARAWRAALGGDLIVAAPVPDHAAGWGPNALGESQIPAMLRDLRSRWLFDPDRVVVAGASAGAHGAWFQAMRHGDLFSSLVAISGTPVRDLYGIHWLDWAGNLSLFPSVALQGTKDPTFTLTSARAWAAHAKQMALPFELREFMQMGHEGAAPADQKAAFLWAIEQVREAFPRKLAWTADHADSARCAWIEMAAFPEDAASITVNFVDDYGKTVEKRRILKECARVTAAVEGQEVRVETAHVARLRVYWSRRLLDVARPATIAVNGREAWKGVPAVSVRFMLEEARRTGRRDRVFEGMVELPVK